MDEKIKKAIREKLRSQNLIKFNEVEEKELYESITDFVDQFLSNYLILGFDLDNKPFIIAKNNNAKDDHSLKYLATNFINRDWHSRK